jgi:hypothetical protein
VAFSGSRGGCPAARQTEGEVATGSTAHSLSSPRLCHRHWRHVANAPPSTKPGLRNITAQSFLASARRERERLRAPVAAPNRERHPSISAPHSAGARQDRPAAPRTASVK